MIYGKKYVVKWTPRLARVTILFFTAIFLMGAVFGFVISKVVGDKERITETTQSETTEPLEVDPIVPDIEINPPIVEKVYYDVPLDHDLQDYIRGLCEEKNVPMGLVIAMIKIESSFRPNVISGTNDYGLMQINTINHEWLSETYGISDFLDPYQNVFCGITIIAGHLEKTDGDITLALMRYNLGAAGARRLWDEGIYSTSYTEKIITAKEMYDNEIQQSDR